MKTTNFDRYLAEQMQDACFAVRFELASKAWDVKSQISRRERVKLSQKYSAKRRYRHDA